MMAADVLDRFRDTTNNLLQLLSKFSPGQFNRVPFADSWTPGQVGDHILKSQKEVPETLTGDTMDCDRDPAEKKDPIKNILLDFSIKLQSPDAILPTLCALDKSTLLNSLSDLSVDIAITFERLDPTAICLDFELPGMGTLTRLELMYFTIHHVQRHIWQLQKMARVM